MDLIWTLELANFHNRWLQPFHHVFEFYNAKLPNTHVPLSTPQLGSADCASSSGPLTVQGLFFAFLYGYTDFHPS